MVNDSILASCPLMDRITYFQFLQERLVNPHLSPFLPVATAVIVRTLFMKNVKKTSVLALSVNTLGVTALLS